MPMTFDEILATIPDEEIINPPSMTFGEHLSAEQQKYCLAWYARVVREHVGYGAFPHQKRKKFRDYITKMYNSAENAKKTEDFFSALAQTKRFIEDNHFFMTYPSYEEPSQPEYHCGKNLCKDGAKVPDGYVAVAGVKNNWEIGTVGKDTLIVSIANMGMSGAHEYKQWEDLIKTFDSLYEKYPHIILDARNNGGGEDKPIHHIVCRLNGNPVNPFSSASVRDTPLSRHLLQHTGMCKKVPEEEKVAGTHCSGRIETLMDETRNFYPFNEQTGYKGRIDVLIDGRTASAGESAYSLFYCLPNVRFVGENTRGMQHYRQARIATPWGGRISVGVMSLDYLHGQMYEMTGNPPDVKVKEGVDALKIALDPATIDLFRQDGFRPEIQEMQERVKSKKSPQYEPDERLTANAGIDGITPDNKATDVRRSQFGNSIVSGLRRIDERNASCDERAPLLRCEGLVPTTPPCVPQQPSKPEALKNNLIIDKIKQRDM